jgi:DNA-binding NarL/FixJ family response regulator
VAKILLAGVDPLFTGKLSELLVGHQLTSTESIEAPDLVVVDVTRIEPEEIADAYPETPILGYASHADPSSLRAAQEAGFDRVVDRAALVENAEDLISELILG